MPAVVALQSITPAAQSQEGQESAVVAGEMAATSFPVVGRTQRLQLTSAGADEEVEESLS